MLHLCFYIAYATVLHVSSLYLLQIIFNCTRERSGLFQLFRRVQSYNQFLTFKKEDIFPFKNNATCLCTF